MLYSCNENNLNMLRHFLILLVSTIMLADSPSAWDSDGDGVFDNIASYQNSASITSQVLTDGIDSGSSGDMLAAFVDEELRGIAPDFDVTFGPNVGKKFFLILIYSNVSSGEIVSFKFYDAETDAVYDVDETYDFISDDTLGNLFDPSVFNTGDIDESYDAGGDDGACNDLDEDGICNDVDDCVGTYDECGECNGNGIDENACDCDGNIDLGCGCGNPAAEENFDCYGDCLISEDCLGQCGGLAVFDECGVCNGNNESCNEGVSLNLNQETGWDLYQSINQAFYFFINPISINGEITSGWEDNQNVQDILYDLQYNYQFHIENIYNE